MEVWGKGLMRMWPLLESSNSRTLRFLVCPMQRWSLSRPPCLNQPAATNKLQVTHVASWLPGISRGSCTR